MKERRVVVILATAHNGIFSNNVYTTETLIAPTTTQETSPPDWKQKTNKENNSQLQLIDTNLTFLPLHPNIDNNLQ